MNWYKTAQVKQLFIMRGLPGSGKSTLAKELGEGGIILSTDDFFIVDGEYKYNPEEIGNAHQWNIMRASDAMMRGVSPVVIDNTNVNAWEAKPYVELGKKHGYNIDIRQAETPWAFNAEELAKRNTHGVPLEIIEKMIATWKPDITIEDIENSEKPDFELPQRIYDDIMFDSFINSEMKQKFPEYNTDAKQGEDAADWLVSKASEKYPDADWDILTKIMFNKFHAGII